MELLKSSKILLKSKRLYLSLFLFCFTISNNTFAQDIKTNCIADYSASDICTSPSRVQTWGGSRVQSNLSYQKEDPGLNLNYLGSFNELWRVGLWGSQDYLKDIDQNGGTFGFLIGAQTTPFRSYALSLNTTSKNLGGNGQINLGMTQLWSKGLYDFSYQAGFNPYTQLAKKQAHALTTGVQIQISPDSSQTGILLYNSI
jgi:hypothetical protein